MVVRVVDRMVVETTIWSTIRPTMRPTIPKMKKKYPKGASLAISIGLLLLLMIITASLSSLVVKALRASGEVEGSERAYFAAEAGVENGLYELSNHSAGYQTSALKTLEVRRDEFSQNTVWKNEWELNSKNQSPCTENDWQNGFEPNVCGQIKSNQKLVINLFNDASTSNNVIKNKIGMADKVIKKINVNSLEIKFRLPKKTVLDNEITGVFIDNDEDYKNGQGLNEDGTADFGFQPTECDGVLVNDNDCDGQEDEDSSEDAVFIWKINDGEGRSFQPLRGCKNDPDYKDHVGSANAGLCEKNFIDEGNGELSLSLNETDLGTLLVDDPNQNGQIVSLLDFITSSSETSPLKIEILSVAPPKTIHAGKAIPIPYYDYGIQYSAEPDQILPDLYFTLKSDGYYKNYKQSITAKVLPGITTKLSDLAIVQQ